MIHACGPVGLASIIDPGSRKIKGRPTCRNDRKSGRGAMGAVVKDIEIAMTGPMMRLVADGLEQHFTVHRPSEAADQSFSARSDPASGAWRPAATPMWTPASCGCPEARNHRQLRRRLRHHGRGRCGRARHRRHQHARRADRRGGRHRDRASCSDTVRELPQAEKLPARRPLAQGSRSALTASLRGRTVGIVGLGRIGKSIARRLEAVRAGDRLSRPQQAGGCPYRYYPTLVGMAHDVDILMVVAPGGPGTQQADQRRGAAKRSGRAASRQIARGTVVDEQALIDALKSAHHPRGRPRCLRQRAARAP